VSIRETVSIFAYPYPGESRVPLSGRWGVTREIYPYVRPPNPIRPFCWGASTPHLAGSVMKPDLPKQDIERLRQVASELLAKLEAEKLRADNWWEKQATRDAVKVEIRDFLWNEETGLPVECYSDQEVDAKAGQVYHLTAGERTSTLRDVADFALDYFRSISGDRSPRRITFIPSFFYRVGKSFVGSQNKAFSRAMDIYEPYLFVRRTFDNSNTIAALRGSGVVNPTFVEYGSAILRYCIWCNWGKRVRRAA